MGVMDAADIRRFLKDLFGGLQMIMLKEWNLVVFRRNAALKRWSQGALWRCLQLWIQSYEEAMSIFEEVKQPRAPISPAHFSLQVREKFSSIVSYISGETMSLMFEEWKSLWSKNKRAAMRYVLCRHLPSSSHLPLKDSRTPACGST